MPSLPEARGGGALALENGNLHYFGGSDINRADAATHWILPFSGGTSWVASTPLPVARNHLGGVTLNGKIYAVGGQKGQDAAAVYTAEFDVWDPATSSWKPLAPLPSARSHIGAASFAMGDRILALGGETSYGVATSQSIAYDPADNSWTQLTPLPVAVHSGVADNLAGVIYYTTGFRTTTYKGVPGNVMRQGDDVGADLDEPVPGKGVTASGRARRAGARPRRRGAASARAAGGTSPRSESACAAARSGGRVRGTSRERADAAARDAREAHRCAEIHQRLAGRRRERWPVRPGRGYVRVDRQDVAPEREVRRLRRRCTARRRGAR